MSTGILHKRDYELFEIHTMPRGIVCITVKSKRSHRISTYDGMWRKSVTLPKGSYGLRVQLNENIPEYVDFIPITTSFRVLHKRVDAIRDALNHTNLHLFIEDKEILPYQKGVRHKVKGMYLGVEKDDDGEYHKFINNNITFKEYIQ